ncbi:MAG TPA: hypothetical protein PLL34_08120 [Candidatus Mcinerneyibacteriales bacterium]|nr:hypothetical protein [Candidatus Mcinerneyibacteriales bacterium]
MKIFSKKGLIALLILAAAGVLFYFTVYKTQINPVKRIETVRIEEGHFLYVVEEYGHFPKERHTLQKVDTSTGKTLWKEKILPAYHLNHQVRRQTPPLFFDETSVYYYVQNMDDSFFLFRFDKESGELLDAVDINAAAEGMKLTDCLWVPYVQTKEKIICFNTVLRDFPEKPVESALHVTVFSKTNGKVSTFTPAFPDLFVLQAPRGLEDDSDFITFYNLPDILVMKKEDPSQLAMISDIYSTPYQDGNILTYLTREGQYVRRDLATGMETRLYSLKESYFSRFRLMIPGGIITYHQDEKSFFLQARDEKGKFKWRYTLPEEYSFYDLYAFQHSDYLPAESAYEATDAPYWPLLITQKSKDDVSPDVSKLVMLDLRNGRPLWTTTLEGDVTCHPDHLYQEGDFYYLLYDHTLYRMDADTGELVRSFQFTLERDGKQVPLLPYYGRNLPLHSFQGEHLAFPFGETFIIKADLNKEEFSFFGKKKRGERVSMTVIRGDSLTLGTLQKEEK